MHKHSVFYQVLVKPDQDIWDLREDSCSGRVDVAITMIVDEPSPLAQGMVFCPFPNLSIVRKHGKAALDAQVIPLKRGIVAPNVITYSLLTLS